MIKRFTFLLICTLSACIGFAQEEQCQIIYRYVNGAQVWACDTTEATIGESYPLLRHKPYGIKYMSVPVGKVSGDETVDINIKVTDDFPIDLYESYEKVGYWGYLQITDVGYYLNWSSNSSTAIDANSSYIGYSAGYQWAFVGNPLTGFEIVNHNAGSDYILTAPAITGDGKAVYPVMMKREDVIASNGKYNRYWSIGTRGTGFTLAREGETSCINVPSTGGKVSFYTSVDNGSMLSFCRTNYSLTKASVDQTKQYYLVNVKTGKYLYEGNQITKTKSEPDETCIWKFISSGEGYVIRNAYSRRSIQPQTGFNTPYSTGGGDFVTYVYESMHSDGCITVASKNSFNAGAKYFMADKGGYTIIWTPNSTITDWKLVEYKEPDVVKRKYVSELKDSTYYRIINRSYTGVAIGEDGGTLLCSEINEKNYSQIWQAIKRDGDRIAFKGLVSNKYIQNLKDAFDSKHKLVTLTTAHFEIAKNTTVDGVDYFNIKENEYALHCNSSKNVVNWYCDNEASQWAFEEVEVTSDIQSIIDAANGGEQLTNGLAKYFEDYACTTMKEEFIAMSDEELTAQMQAEALPTPLQEMALRVKNNNWGEDKTRAYYEKFYRIADYEAYSTNGWAGILGTNTLAQLNNPTGIRAKAGDIVYILVNDTIVKGAKLAVEYVTECKAYGAQVTLHQGCNSMLVTSDCELFIAYIVTNAGTSSPRLLANYPPIKIQIAGGVTNGCFDVHRGQSNNDMAYLLSNMLESDYVHLKTDHVEFNVLKSEIETSDNLAGAMGIWEMSFTFMEDLIGANQYADKYNCMVSASYEPEYGAPYATTYGTFHPSMLHLFNYNAMAHPADGVGATWEITHEQGHNHQAPIRTTGTTEITNNMFANAVCMKQGFSTTRGTGAKYLCEKFNQGYSWVDLLKGGNNEKDGCLWLANRLYTQLYQYFHVMGHMPDFYQKVFDYMRAHPLKRSTSSSSPAQINSDYLLFATACAEVSGYDLTELFEAYGFFRTAGEVKCPDSGDNLTKGVFCVGDYATYYLKVPTTADYYSFTALRNLMASKNKFGGNIMFIDDRIRDTPATYEGAPEGRMKNYYASGIRGNMGDVGQMEDFTDDNHCSEYTYEATGTTVKMSGKGAVGYKIYTPAHKLVWIANTNTFTTTEEIVNGLNDGTYELWAAGGDMVDIYANNTLTNIKAIENNDPAETTQSNKIYDLQGREVTNPGKGIYIINGKKTMIK